MNSFKTRKSSIIREYLSKLFLLDFKGSKGKWGKDAILMVERHDFFTIS